MTAGAQHREHIVAATIATHTFLKKMGARGATHKNILFSSIDTTRQHLRKFKLPYDDNNINVSNNFRDLGAHVNLTATAHSVTLSD